MSVLQSDGTSNNIVQEIFNTGQSDYANDASDQPGLPTNIAQVIDAQLLQKSTSTFKKLNVTNQGANNNANTASTTDIAVNFASIRPLPTHFNRITPADCQFLAENCLISIVPKFTTSQPLQLISCDIPAFRPTRSVTVPVWTALMLKRQRKCRIEKPNWMDAEKLEKLKEEELGAAFFQEPPHAHYRELSTVLLNRASDDIENADKIRTAIKDLWDTRTGKLLTTLKQFMNQPEENPDSTDDKNAFTGRIKERQQMYGDIRNITQLELTMFRDTVLSSMDIKRTLIEHKNTIN